MSDFLKSELDVIQSKFLSSLKMFDRLSLEEKIAMAYQVDLFEELKRLGLSDVIESMMDEYASIIADLSKLREKGVAPLGFQDLSLIAELDAEALLGRAEAYAKEFKSALMKGFLSGESTDAIKQRLTDINLTNNQTIVAINTARDEFQSTALSKLFEDEPETRFKLSDYPLDDRTRCSCRAVIMNQPKDGWTKEEIDNGAATKIAKQYCPTFEGKYGFVNRGGYNCRHIWEIV